MDYINRDHLLIANGLNQAIGVSYQQQPGYVVGGVDRSGRTFFVDPSLANNADPTAGSGFTTNFFKTFNPFNIINDDHASTLDKIGSVASDASLIANLDLMYQQGAKPKQWMDFLLSNYGKAGIKNLSSDPGSQSQLNSALSAYLLFSKWGSLSPAQKAIGLASTGVQGMDAFTGSNLAKTIIPGSQSLVDGTGVTVGAAMQGLDFGVNAYALANNWGQLDTLGKIAYGTNTLAQGAQLARSLGMIGTGTTGATTSLTAEGLSQIGASAPSYGIGAISLNPGASVPYGYSLLPNAGSTAGTEGLSLGANGESIAVPTANAETASVGASSTLGQVAGVAGIAAGSYTVMKNWGAGGAKGAAVSGLGGASIATGLYALGATNPYLLAGVVAFSALSGAIHTGKPEDQLKRDAVRDVAEKVGLSKDYKVQLADGSLADIGADGHDALHTFRYGDKAVNNTRGDKDNLFSYDIDYTNDLDFFAGMGGTTLSRLLTGGNDKNIKQLGGQFGNASLGKVGYGQDMTPENFSTVMGNLKGMFAKSGISNKSDAVALTNELYGQGRINDFDHAQMLQSINMVFDNDFKLANNLNAGRFAGIKVASDATLHPNSPVNPDVLENTLRAKAGATAQFTPSQDVQTLPEQVDPGKAQSLGDKGLSSVSPASVGTDVSSWAHPNKLLQTAKTSLPQKNAYLDWNSGPVNLQTMMPANIDPAMAQQIKSMLPKLGGMSLQPGVAVDSKGIDAIKGALSNLAPGQTGDNNNIDPNSELGKQLTSMFNHGREPIATGNPGNQWNLGGAIRSPGGPKPAGGDAFDLTPMMSKEQAIAANKARYGNAFDVGGATS